MKTERDRKNPSSHVFWNDLENDESLRACSLAAKGLWACHLLPMAKRSVMPGVVIVGEHPSRWDRDLPALLARLVGESPEVIAALLAELVQSGTASVDNMGRIVNRRMAREAKVSAERSRAGRQGALATNASRQTGRQKSGKGVGKDPGKGSGKPIGKQSGKTPATESEVNADGISTIRDEAAADVRQNAGKASGNDPGNTVGKSSASSIFSSYEDSMRVKPLQGLTPEEHQTSPPVAARERLEGAPRTTAMGRPRMASRVADLLAERRKEPVAP